MAKWWCLLAMEKLHVSTYSGHLQVLKTFLLNAPSLRTRKQNPESRPTSPPRTKSRKCQTNQFHKPPPPNIGTYKIPHLQSQFPPNPTPTQPERSTPSYLQIHWRNRHPTKLSLTKARKMNDDEISTSTRSLGILYKTLLARKLSKPEDGRYRPQHVVFLLLINTIT